MPLRRLIGLAALVLAACPSVDIAGGRCDTDADCSGGTCLFDLTLGTSYCSQVCTDSADCPRSQSCRTGVQTIESGSPETKLCVERVRACGVETCNGLDDDCDGTIDDECTPVTRCLDDEPCGAFVCTAASGAAETTCVPPNPNARTPAFSACSADSECENALCETGVCSPMCRGPSDPVCPFGTVCARAVGPKDRVEHNACQDPCGRGQGSCAAPLECVWRTVVGGGELRGFVCSLPGPERLPLGSTCPRNDAAGDDTCAHGLCYDRVCTRHCGGPGSSCADIGAGFICQETTLFYGGLELADFVCVRP